MEEDWKEQYQLPLNFGKIINMAKGELWNWQFNTFHNNKKNVMNEWPFHGTTVEMDLWELGGITI